MFSYFKKSKKTNPTKMEVNFKQVDNQSSTKLESVEEENYEETLKSFGITEKEISNLKKAKKTDVSNAIKNCGISESEQDFFFKFVLE